MCTLPEAHAVTGEPACGFSTCRASTGTRSRTEDCRATFYVDERERTCLHREYVESSRRVSGHAAYKRSRPDSRTARRRVRDGFWRERERNREQQKRLAKTHALCAFPVLTRLPGSRVAFRLPLGTPSTVACHRCTSCCNKSRHVWELRARA
jgi:hypothetical protein